VAALASWRIARSEYLLLVPANGIGHGVFSAGQLKILGRRITDGLCALCDHVYEGTPKIDFLWSGLCLVGTVYFAFRTTRDGVRGNRVVIGSAGVAARSQAARFLALGSAALLARFPGCRAEHAPGHECALALGSRRVDLRPRCVGISILRSGRHRPIREVRGQL
jgi:hypothetical protein